MAAMTQDRVVGALCGVLAVLLFSSFTLMSRLGLSSSLLPADLAALRFGIGGMLLLPVLLQHGLRGVSWRSAATLAVLGGLGFAPLAYAGFALAPAAHGAVLLHGTLPLFTAALLPATRSPRVRSFSLGIALIAVGILLMACDSWVRYRPTQLIGDACLLLASLSWAAYGVQYRRSGLSSSHAASVVTVFSMCAFLPLYALFPHEALLRLGTRDLLAQALVQGVLIGCVSISVYTRAVTALGPSVVSLLAAAVPCITTVAASALLQEHSTPVALSGVALVTLGMLIDSRLAAAR